MPPVPYFVPAGLYFGMLNRRSFLWLTSLGGVTAACSPSPAPTKSSESAAEQTLPPSIAALTSMRDQATPITADERRARAERARKLMAEHKIDALMLTSGTSMVYFANVNWSGGERLFAVVIPQKGEPFAVCPSFEEERAREQLALGPPRIAFHPRDPVEDHRPPLGQGIGRPARITRAGEAQEGAHHRLADGAGVAIIAGALGFGGIASAAAGIAKVLFVVFLILLVVSLVTGFVGAA